MSVPLGARALVVVTGKGGVGKSTIAAALGFALAGAGRRVLVLEIDPRDTLHRLFDTAPSDGDVVRVVSVADGAVSRELCGGCHVRRTGDIGRCSGSRRSSCRRCRWVRCSCGSRPAST